MSKKIVIPTEGMHCTGCERNVRFALSALGGVEDVAADHEAARVEITFDEDATSEDELRRAIEDIGYRVTA